MEEQPDQTTRRGDRLQSHSCQLHKILDRKRPHGMVAVDIVQQPILLVWRENLVTVPDLVQQMVDPIDVYFSCVGMRADGSNELILEYGW